MRPEDLAEIRFLPLFRNMLQANFVALMQAAYAQRFPAGIELIRQGGRADFLHVVVEGSVELYADWQGRSTTMAVVQPVGTFILAACVRDLPYLMSARTLVPSRVLLVPASDLRAIFRSDPEFAVSIVGELAGAFRSMARHAKNLKLRTSRERIACYLLKQSQLAGGADRFVLQVEKRLVASYLGMTPENLSRALKTLVADGVEMKGQTVTITDRAKLMAACPPDILIDGPDPEAISGGVSLPGPALPRGR
jgi:CRP/FNR family transcriptional regulator, transcriptional activator FtrB